MAQKVTKKVTKKRVKMQKVMLYHGQVPADLDSEVLRNLLLTLHRWLLKQQQRLH